MTQLASTVLTPVLRTYEAVHIIMDKVKNTVSTTSTGTKKTVNMSLRGYIEARHAALEALDSVSRASIWPCTVVRECLFHFKQALLRKAVSKPTLSQDVGEFFEYMKFFEYIGSHVSPAKHPPGQWNQHIYLLSC